MTGKIIQVNRRVLLAGMAAAGAVGLLPRQFAQAQSQPGGAYKPTETMRGGANNYEPNAPLVENLGTGFVVTGLVRRAGNGEPLRNVRVQIWTATDRGGEQPRQRHDRRAGPLSARDLTRRSAIRPAAHPYRL